MADDEAFGALAQAKQLAEEAWDLAAQAKEKAQEARELVAGVGGPSPHETLEQALNHLDEGYGQVEAGQGGFSQAQVHIDEWTVAANALGE